MFSPLNVSGQARRRAAIMYHFTATVIFEADANADPDRPQERVVPRIRRHRAGDVFNNPPAAGSASSAQLHFAKRDGLWRSAHIPRRFCERDLHR